MKLLNKIFALTLSITMALSVNAYAYDYSDDFLIRIPTTKAEQYTEALSSILYENVHFSGAYGYDNYNLEKLYLPNELKSVEFFDFDNDGIMEMIVMDTNNNVSVVTLTDEGYVFLDMAIPDGVVESCGISAAADGKFLVLSGFVENSQFHYIYVKQGLSMTLAYKLEEVEIVTYQDDPFVPIIYNTVYRCNDTDISESEYNYLMLTAMHKNDDGYWYANKMLDIITTDKTYDIGGGETLTIRAYNTSIDGTSFSSYYDAITYRDWLIPMDFYGTVAIKFVDMDGDGLREMIYIGKEEQYFANIYTISDGKVIELCQINHITGDCSFGISQKNGKNYFVIRFAENENENNFRIYEKSGLNIKPVGVNYTNYGYDTYYSCNGKDFNEITVQEYNNICSKYLSNNGEYFGFSETIQPFSDKGAFKAYIEKISTNNY